MFIFLLRLASYNAKCESSLNNRKKTYELRCREADRAHRTCSNILLEMNHKLELEFIS